MFLALVFRWLANHHNPQVAARVGAILVTVAVGVTAAGIAIYQPIVIRIGVLLVIVGAASLVTRDRHNRTEPARDRE